MKKPHCLCLFALFLCQFAFAGPDFSGRWVYDKSMSTLPNTGDLVIVHSGQTLGITNELGFRSATMEYILDGVEHTYLGRSGSNFRYKAVLDGSTLRITGYRNVPSLDVVNRPIDDTYILSPDNKMLTYLTLTSSRVGPPVRTQVFRRQ
jgi:hypothetical protein